MLQRSDHPEPGLHLCSGDPAGHPVQGHRGPEGDQRLKDRYISIFAVVVVSAPNKATHTQVVVHEWLSVADCGGADQSGGITFTPFLEIQVHVWKNELTQQAVIFVCVNIIFIIYNKVNITVKTSVCHRVVCLQ